MQKDQLAYSDEAIPNLIIKEKKGRKHYTLERKDLGAREGGEKWEGREEKGKES